MEAWPRAVWGIEGGYLDTGLLLKSEIEARVRSVKIDRIFTGPFDLGSQSVPHAGGSMTAALPGGHQAYAYGRFRLLRRTMLPACAARNHSVN